MGEDEVVAVGKDDGDDKVGAVGSVTPPVFPPGGKNRRGHGAGAARRR